VDLRWKIRARCFAKSPIRPHPVCNFDFVDASGEIRLTAFRDECTRFHPMIEIDKVNLFQNKFNESMFFSPPKRFMIFWVFV
jgi:hypothetical protein